MIKYAVNILWKLSYLIVIIWLINILVSCNICVSSTRECWFFYCNTMLALIYMIILTTLKLTFNVQQDTWIYQNTNTEIGGHTLLAIDSISVFYYISSRFCILWNAMSRYHLRMWLYRFLVSKRELLRNLSMNPIVLRCIVCGNNRRCYSFLALLIRNLIISGGKYGCCSWTKFFILYQFPNTSDVYIGIEEHSYFCFNNVLTDGCCLLYFEKQFDIFSKSNNSLIIVNLIIWSGIEVNSKQFRFGQMIYIVYYI